MVSFAMQAVTCTPPVTVGMLCLWLSLVLNPHPTASGAEEIRKNGSSASITSHSNRAACFHRNGTLTEYLFTLVRSTDIQYQYRVLERIRGQKTKYFRPDFVDGKDRWNVIVGFSSQSWLFYCQVKRSKEVEMSRKATTAYVEKALFFGWAGICRKEGPIYVIAFVRGLHIYIRAYNNTGWGKNIELVADLGLAKVLPVDARHRVYVGGAGQQYLDAVLAHHATGDGAKRETGCRRPPKIERMILSGDEELRNVFPDRVDYEELYRKKSFSPISDFSFESRKNSIRRSHKMAISFLLQNP